MLFGGRWATLRTKIIAWSFIPTMIILVMVAAVIYIAYQQVTEDLVIERNRELTRLAASQIAAQLTEYVNLLDAEARRAVIADPNPTTQQDGLRAARMRLASFDAGVVILDTFGTVVATEPERPGIPGLNWSDRVYYREMLRSAISGSAKPVFSNIVSDGPDGTNVIVVATPISGKQGQFLGLIVGMFSIEALSQGDLGSSFSELLPSKRGRTSLFDGQGRPLYNSIPDPHRKNTLAHEFARQALNGEVGAVRTRDANGQAIVASFAPVPGTPWGLISEENWAGLASSGRGYQRFLLFLLLLGILVPTLVVAFGLGRITRPIADLMVGAQRVAEGDFSQTITAHTGDEIEDLAEQFNLMAGQLQASYAQLERTIENRTRELAAVNAIAIVVSQSLNLEEILDDALEETLQVMGNDAGGIYLLDERAGMLNIVTQRGLDPQRVAGIDGLRLGEGFSGRVAQSGQPLVVADITSDPRLTRLTARDEGLDTLAIVPLCSREKVLGTLFVASRDHRDFSDQDLELLTAIGHQVGIAVENARLFGQAEQRLQELEALYHADEEIYRHLRMGEVLQALVDVAVDVLNAQRSSVLTWHEAQQAWVFRATRGFGPETLDSMPSALGRRIAEEVTAGSGIAVAGDMRVDLHQKEFEGDVLQILVEEGIRSCMHLPIEIGGEVFGIFSIWFDRPRSFRTGEQRLFMALAQRAEVAIENARLFRAEQRRTEQFRVISELGRRITAILSVDELLDHISRLIREAFGYYAVAIGLVEDDEVVFKTGVGAFWDVTQLHENLRLKVGVEGITGWVAAAGEPLLVPDVSQEPRFYYLPEIGETRSEICVPMKTKGEVIGILGAQSNQLDGFDEGDLEVLQAMADQAAIAIETARLYEQAQQLAVVEERSRLARDLHDAVTQTLFSASLIAETLPELWQTDEEDARQLLGELRQLSRGALAEMRTLLLELRPSALIETRQEDLLRQLGEAVTGRSGLAVGVTVSGLCTLPPDVHVAFYRIAQEALNNVEKHANASRVLVSLRCASSPQGPSQQSVYLAVRDDGRGFDPSQLPTDRLGLGIIRERATAIGANLQIDSHPGHGTQIKVRWEQRREEGSGER